MAYNSFSTHNYHIMSNDLRKVIVKCSPTKMKDHLSTRTHDIMYGLKKKIQVEIDCSVHAY